MAFDLNPARSLVRRFALSAFCFLLLSFTALPQVLPGGTIFGGDAFAPGFVTETHADSSAFADIQAGLSGAWAGNATWFDYDNDGDLDVLASGWDDTTYFSKIYRNDSDGFFTDIHAPLIGLGTERGLAWADYDNDGDYDIAMAGRADTLDHHLVTAIYRNDDGVFVDIHAPLLALAGGSVSWSDYDNDGAPDLFVCGSSDGGTTFASRLYRNEHGGFVEHATSIPGVWGSTAAWGDYDNDGDEDLFIAGWGGASIARLFRNDGGNLTAYANFFNPITSGAAAWIDYDADGDLDLSWNGFTGGSPVTHLYRNDSSTSSALRLLFVPLPFAALGASALAWGDFDNDGDLDFAESGAQQQSGTGPTTKIYRNDGSAFVDIGAFLPGVWFGSLAWGDYDNDGRLDLLITGGTNGAPVSSLTGPFAPITRIYRNTLTGTNSPPAVPSGLSASVQNGRALLVWQRASDAQTPTEGLTYNVRLGTAPGKGDIMNALAREDGYRRIPRSGNAGPLTGRSVAQLAPGTYYWSVQSVDNAFGGSAFAQEDSFAVIATGVEDPSLLPGRLELLQNYPNPFNPATVITYTLPEAARVLLTVYDVLGREVATLVDGTQEAGSHLVTMEGGAIPTGVYCYTITAGRFTASRKMLLMR